MPSSVGSTGGSHTSSKKQGSKKKKVSPVSLDEVFNLVSSVTATNANATPAPVVLTPRSAEVCLKLGVNPEILKIRDIDSFWEGGVDPTVQRMRHEAYVQRRYELVKQCRLERKKLINSQLESETYFTGDADALSPEKLLEKQKEQSSTLIAMELKRIEKMQKRQEKELEQMIQYEVTRAQIQAEMDRKLEEARKKEELRKKQEEKRMKLVAEERRLKELQKMAMQEAEENNRRVLAREMHEREAMFAEQKAREAELEKRKRREQELERAAKHEEHKKQVQRFFEEEQMRIRKRLETMQDAEKKKQQAILAKQAQLAEELRLKRLAVEERIERNMRMAEQVEEERKNEFFRKQEAFEKIRNDHLRKQEEERNLHAQEVQLQEQRRRMILLQQQREEEAKKEFMLQKFEEEEVHLQEVEDMREKEQQLLKEKKKIRTHMKLENVDRVHRANEYKRMEILKQIEDNDKRTKALLTQKQSLIDERRKTASQTRLQKENIGKVMDEIRSNANKAQKLITQALSGKVTLASLQGTSSPGPKRPKSGTMNKSKTTASLLNMSNTNGPNTRNSMGGGMNGRSSSAPDGVGTNDGDESAFPPNTKFAFGKEPEKASAYVSPYTGTNPSN